MENRLYFLFGDLFSNIAVGASAAALIALLVTPEWPMLTAMFVSMALGMWIAVLLGFAVLLRYFGAMEIMLPTMMSGMLAGMITGMLAAKHPIPLIDALLLGTVIGTASCIAFWIGNSLLSGRTNF